MEPFVPRFLITAAPLLSAPPPVVVSNLKFQRNSRHFPAQDHSSRAEIVKIFRQLRGAWFILASLHYSLGLSFHQCLKLRVADLNFKRHHLLLRKNDSKEATVVTLSPELEGVLHRYLKGRGVKLTLQNQRTSEGKLLFFKKSSDCGRRRMAPRVAFEKQLRLAAQRSGCSFRGTSVRLRRLRSLHLKGEMIETKEMVFPQTDTSPKQTPISCFFEQDKNIILLTQMLKKIERRSVAGKEREVIKTAA